MSRRKLKAPRRFPIFRQQVVKTCAKVLGSRSNIKKRGGALSARERDFILATLFLGKDPRLTRSTRPRRALSAATLKRLRKVPRDPVTGKFLPRARKRRKT